MTQLDQAVAADINNYRVICGVNNNNLWTLYSPRLMSLQPSHVLDCHVPAVCSLFCQNLDFQKFQKICWSSHKYIRRLCVVVPIS